MIEAFTEQRFRADSLSIIDTANGIWRADAASGEAPTEPAATCRFCVRMAATTSPAVRPRAAMRSGSSQTRRLYSPAPHTTTLLTPGTRSRASRTCSWAKLDRCSRS